MATATVALTLAALLLVATVGAAGAADSGTTGEATVRQVDINKASTTELTAIPGVGNALAQRIVEFREEHGPFQRIEDLLKIKGIGEKSFQKMKPHVKVEKDD
jgi:competence protein ComEA